MYDLLLYILSIVLGISAVVIAGIFYLYQSHFQHWNKRNIPFKKATFPFGNFAEANFTKNIGQVVTELYEESKTQRIYGIFSFYKPNLLVNDPELVKKIFVSDFAHFQDRGIYINEEKDPLSAHLFSISGTPWRNLRVKLTPTFTSGKMKMMFHTLVSVSENLQKYLQKPAQHNEVLEVKDIMARFTTDIIASCAFGLELNSLENPDSEFRKMGRRIFEVTTWEALKVGMSFTMPEVAAFFKITQTKKDVEKFFLAAVDETIKYRENNNVSRNDFLQLLIQLKNKGYIDDADSKKRGEIEEAELQGDKFTMLQAAAQAFVFFVAGFETSSTTLQFALYELAKNQVVQDKTRAEVDAVLKKHDGKLSYDGLMEMQYLDMVVSETLRKYPPVPFLTRECTKPYKVPDFDLLLEKGSIVQVPILGFHWDPQYFPEPEKFKPERFTEEEKSKRHHFSYLPFGEGPRNCIGNRFGLMQTKAGLAAVLSKYKVSVCKQTPIPLVYEPTSFLLSPKGGMHLQISNRS